MNSFSSGVHSRSTGRNPGSLARHPARKPAGMAVVALVLLGSCDIAQDPEAIRAEAEAEFEAGKRILDSIN